LHCKNDVPSSRRHLERSASSMHYRSLLVLPSMLAAPLLGSNIGQVTNDGVLCKNSVKAQGG
jgi:hypothetical protein